MIARIQNKIGVQVDIPHYDGRKYQYHEFFMDKAGNILCQNVLGRRWPVKPPYTVTKRFYGTNETSIRTVE